MCLQSETVASRLLLPRHILPVRYTDFLSDCPDVFRMLGICALRSCVPAELRLVLNLQFNSPVSQSCTSYQDIPTSIGVRRVPDHNDVLEVQLDEHFSEIVGVLIHIVALPRLVGAAKTAAVMATKLAITFTVGGRRIFHQQVSVLGRVTMRLIWILSREGPCVRLSVVCACVPRAACAFLAGEPLDVRR